MTKAEGIKPRYKGSGDSDIAVIAQLLTAIRDAISEMKKAQRKKNLERVAEAKREILSFQRKLDEIL